MKTIEFIISSTSDSFGTKKIIFIAKEGGLFQAYADEGSHSDLKVGKKVSPSREIFDGNCNIK